MAGNFIDFTLAPPAPAFAKTTFAIATAADNQEDFMFVNGVYLEWIQTGANADIVFVKGTTGFTIPNDNLDNDGIEITQGITAADKVAFTIGTSAAFFVKLKMKIPDVSDYDVCAVGFRKRAAYGDSLAAGTIGGTYTDYICFNVDAGAIYLSRNLNAGGVVAVDTALTWADNATKTLEVRVSSAGVCTYAVDGTTLTAVQAGTAAGFTLDSTDVVIPFMAFTKNAGAASDTPPILIEYDCGPLPAGTT